MGVTLFEYQQLFPGVPTEHLEIAQARFEVRHAAPGEVVAQVDSEDASVICVVDGELEVLREGVVLASVGPGELIGEITLFGYRPRRTATVRARRACRLIRLDAASFHDLAGAGNGVPWVIERLAIEQLGARARRAEAKIIHQAFGTPFKWPTPTAREETWWTRLRDAVRGAPPPSPGPAPLRIDVAAELAALPRFAEVPADVLAMIAPWFEAQSIPAHHTVFRQGETGDRWFMLLAGQVTRLFELPPDPHHPAADPRVHKLRPTERGGILGIVSQIDGRPRTLTALADTPLRVLVMKQSKWHRAVAADTRAASTLRRTVIQAMVDELEARNETVIWLERSTAPLHQDRKATPAEGSSPFPA